MASVNLADIRDFDYALMQKTRDEIAKIYHDHLENYKKECEDHKGKFWIGYQQYLISHHWKEVRRKVLHRDPVCQVCFDRNSTQAHHLTYASYKKYGISFAVECVGVCELCHDSLHGKDIGNV